MAIVPATSVGSATGGAGAVTQIADTTLGGAGAIDFLAIAGTFNHLLILCDLRGTQAAISAQCAMTFNNDSTANYDYQNEFRNAGASGGNVANAAAGIFLPGIVGASAAAAYAGNVEIFIPNYAGTTFNKTARIIGGRIPDTGAVNPVVEDVFGLWRSNVAITRVTLTGSGGTLAAGSRATLYGVT